MPAPVSLGILSGVAPFVYNPDTDAGLFWRMSGAATDDGAGLATQVNDVAGARHVAFPSGARPTIVASDATANNRRTLLFAGAQRGQPINSVAADFRKMHDTTTAKLWVVFKPSSAATVNNETLWHDGAGFSAGVSGISVIYDGARQTVACVAGRGANPLMYYLSGPTAECARDVWHILVVEKDAAGVTVWLDGAKILDGEWAGVPSSANAPTLPYIGGDPNLGHFRGHLAEQGITTGAASALAITSWARIHYGIVTTRAPNRRLCWQDGLNLAAVSPVPTVRSYFTKTTATPNATQVVGVGIDFGSTFTARARSTGEYELDVITQTRAESQVSWFELVDGSMPGPGAVAPGKTRVIYLAMGESGMAGYSATTPRPAGYPPSDSSVWALDAEFNWIQVSEPLISIAGKYPVDGIANPTTAGMGPAGMFAWRRQQALGSSYEVGVLLCAKGGTKTSDWNTNKNLRINLLGAAIARLRRALKTPGTVFGGFLWDIGINEATAASSTWTANMDAIMAYVRTAVPATANAPVYYSRLFSTAPTDQSYPSWAAVGADEDAWETTVAPERIKVVSEPTDWLEPAHVHRGPLSNATFGQAYADAAAAHPAP